MSTRGWHAHSLRAGLACCFSGAALSIPPGRALIEQSMVWHMVIQMPMLVAAGWWLLHGGTRSPAQSRGNEWNQYGLTAFITSQLIFAYWMLPLAIDRAVVLPQADVLKIISLVACGALLKAAFERSPAGLQLFFVGYAVSMLMTAGVFLATTDRRLCNAYSLGSQLNAGGGVVSWGVLLGAAWALRLFQAARRQRRTLTPTAP